jgi:alcohol dehydrogenase
MADSARAMVLKGPRQLEEVSIDLPEIGDDDALLRVEACGLCGTDHEQYTGHIKRDYSYIPGHEAVGRIERIGPLAQQLWGVGEGDLVAVEPLQSCRHCKPCVSGDYQRCVKHGHAHFYGIKDINSTPSGLLGGYSTHMYMSLDYRVLKVPANLSAVEATLFNPVGAGFRWGVTVPRTRPGDVCAVLGPGIRGLSACAAMKEAGAQFVMLTGRGKDDRARLDIAKDFGADLVVDVAEENPAHAMKRALGRLADVVLDVTAKAPAALAQSMTIAKPGGTICIAGIRASSDAPGFQPDHIVFKELTIVGVAGVDTPAYERAFELLTSGKYPFADLPRRVVGLREADDLLAAMAGKDSGDRPVHGVVAPQKA